MVAIYNKITEIDRRWLPKLKPSGCAESAYESSLNQETEMNKRIGTLKRRRWICRSAASNTIVLNAKLIPTEPL